MNQPTPRPILIASWNGLAATRRAAERYAAGLPLLDAIVEGVGLVEDDPEEMSVGYGGLPNEDGIVELDAAVMDGPLHRVGAVAGLRGVRRAAALALEVLKRTDHSLLVGEGALKFARMLGFKEEDLLTERAREAFLAWKAKLSDHDAWVAEDQGTSRFGTARRSGLAEVSERLTTDPGTEGPAARETGPKSIPASSEASPIPFTTGTIHVSGVDARGDLFAVTSTSGLSYKIAGRVGDSPVSGAGIYTDNAVGSAGATGRGEAVLQNCGAYAVVREMESGRSPEEACLAVLKRIADHTREKRLLDEKGRPAFNVTLYALRKDGTTGSASMHEGYQHAVQRGARSEVTACAWLFEK